VGRVGRVGHVGQVGHAVVVIGRWSLSGFTQACSRCPAVTGYRGRDPCEPRDLGGVDVLVNENSACLASSAVAVVVDDLRKSAPPAEPPGSVPRPPRYCAWFLRRTSAYDTVVGQHTALVGRWHCRRGDTRRNRRNHRDHPDCRRSDASAGVIGQGRQGCQPPPRARYSSTNADSSARRAWTRPSSASNWRVSASSTSR
jgi:hypothetical protein